MSSLREPCGRCVAYPFVEGNRRAVFTPILLFLGLNRIDFDVSPAAATAMILALAAGETDGLARWIEDNISPPSGR